MPIYNFCAGPSHLPPVVLEATQEALLDYNNSGLSLAEISHRSDAFIEILGKAKALVRQLLAVPDTHEILFVGGGASTQFVYAPYNLLKTKAAYLNTGIWAQKAMDEAQFFGRVLEIASSQSSNYAHLPRHFDCPHDVDYLHLTSNNTIFGTQWHHDFDLPVPLVADMSSDIFSRPIAIERYSLIYAGGQKNLSMAGLALLIVNREALGKTGRNIPKIIDYRQHISAPDGMYHTPPVVPIYTALCSLQWIAEQGGVCQMQNRAALRAALLYESLDNSPCFVAHVQEKNDRSHMNVPFRLQKHYAHLENTFLDFAQSQGLMNLRGHRLAGGFRASIYNAMPLEGVQALCGCLHEFATKYAS